jgi:hypothetical protein
MWFYWISSILICLDNILNGFRFLLNLILMIYMIWIQFNSEFYKICIRDSNIGHLSAVNHLWRWCTIALAIFLIYIYKKMSRSTITWCMKQGSCIKLFSLKTNFLNFGEELWFIRFNFLLIIEGWIHKFQVVVENAIQKIKKVVV